MKIKINLRIFESSKRPSKLTNLRKFYVKCFESQFEKVCIIDETSSKKKSCSFFSDKKDECETVGPVGGADNCKYFH